jgi:hypothetical protein
LPENNYAIAARTVHWKAPQTGIRTQFRASEFKKLDEQTWVPTAATIRYFDHATGSKPVIESMLQVVEVALDPPGEYFNLQTDQVRNFFDQDRNMKVRMEPLQGRTVRELLDMAKPGRQYAGNSTAILVVLLNVGLILILVYLWRRRAGVRN